MRSHPDRVDVSVLRDYPAYRDFRERSRAKQPADSTAVDMRESGETSSPEDLIDAAVAENRAAVEGEILKKALSLTPTGFENLVIALLEAMGYGRAGSIQRTSATGDAGIDGIISQDPLGSTESMCRPSGMRLTAPSIVRRFMNSPAHCWESRATAASSLRPRGSPPERSTKRNGSTRA